MDPLSLVLSFTGLLAIVRTDYQLEQVIDPIICTTTSVQSGVIISISSNCDESYTPTLTDVIVTDTTLVLRGKFDAGNARSFRINVFDQWFTMGQSVQLTTSGNDWQLDLSDRRKMIPPGTYDIVLEMLTKNSLFYSDTISNRLTIPIAAIIDDDTEEVKPPEGPLADTGENVALLMLAAAAISAGGIVILRWLHKTRPKK